MSEEKPNCYNCKHRGEVARSYHSSCRHPKLGTLHIKGDEHGRRNGWFHWPSNFDPAWLRKCDGFEPGGAGEKAAFDRVNQGVDEETQRGAQIVDLFGALKRSLEK